MKKTCIYLMLLMLSVTTMAATVRWIGGTTAVAQVDHYTPANIEEDDVFTLTATGDNEDTVAISYTAAAVVDEPNAVIDVVEGLAAAWNASTNYLCTSITATEDDLKVILTADTAGVPFAVASSATDGGVADTQVLTESPSVANAGPYDWGTAANWDSGTVPGAAADQDVYVEGGTILYGLNQSAIANTLDEIHVINSQIGSNPSSGRAAGYLRTKVTKLYIGDHWGPGSLVQATPVMIDTGTVASTITVYNSGTNSTTTLPSVWLKATNSGTKLIAYGGKIGLCYDKASTTTIGDIENSGAYIYSGDQLGASSYEQTSGSSLLHFGSALASYRISGGTSTVYGYGYGVTNANVHGGSVSFYTPVTNLNVFDGTTTILTDSADGDTGTAVIKGGTVYYQGSGGITTLDIYSGTVDCRNGASSRTITTCRMDPGAVLIYNMADITITNAITPKSTNQLLQVSYETP